MDGLETPNESRETVHRNECRKGVVEEVAAAKVRLVSQNRKWFVMTLGGRQRTVVKDV